jgi:hypothetical protein
MMQIRGQMGQMPKELNGSAWALQQRAQAGMSAFGTKQTFD